MRAVNRFKRKRVISNGPQAAHARIGNTLLKGGGGETLQDRGSLGNASERTLNPYYSNSALYRWREYVNWYMTSWEARKLIDIPVDDALRIPVEIEGLKKDDKDRLCEYYYEKLHLDKQLRRGLIQERLLGGSILLGLFLRPADECLSEPLRSSSLIKGDFQGVNVIDVSRISKTDWENNPFAVNFDRVNAYTISGVNVDRSRLCVLDGNALFGPNGGNILQGPRANPNGFGESKLATLYDSLVRNAGTQQGAYHLVNMASVLLIGADRLRSLKATGSKEIDRMQEILQSISIYRGALLEGQGVEIKQHSATFGSVPELVWTYANLLAAGADVPATRFLGQSPGGLNSTGESDLENYYNMVGTYQTNTVQPVQQRLFDWTGSTIWGWQDWKLRSRDMKLTYESLWSQSELEEAQTSTVWAEAIKGLYAEGLINEESALNELMARNIFKTQVEAGDFLSRQGQETVSALDAFSAIGNADYDENKHKRADDGKFSTQSGGGGGGKDSQDIESSGSDYFKQWDDAPTLEIKGDELGKYQDKAELRQKAVDYYKQNLQGTTVQREDIGEVRFSGKGLNEFEGHAFSEDKIKGVVALKQIVGTGKLGKFEPAAHPRKDDIVGFYPIMANTKMGDKTVKMEVLVGKHFNGNLFYDLFADYQRTKIANKKAPSNTEQQSRLTGALDEYSSRELNIAIYD